MPIPFGSLCRKSVDLSEAKPLMVLFHIQLFLRFASINNFRENVYSTFYANEMEISHISFQGRGGGTPLKVEACANYTNVYFHHVKGISKVLNE